MTEPPTTGDGWHDGHKIPRAAITQTNENGANLRKQTAQNWGIHMDWRETHNEGVYACKNKLAGIQERLAGLTAEAEELSTLVAMATGGHLSGNDYGREAFEKSTLVPDRIQELFRLTEEIHGNLDSYAAGY